MRAGRLTLGCAALLQIATARAHGIRLDLAQFRIREQSVDLLD